MLAIRFLPCEEQIKTVFADDFEVKVKKRNEVIDFVQKSSNQTENYLNTALKLFKDLNTIKDTILTLYKQLQILNFSDLALSEILP